MEWYGDGIVGSWPLWVVRSWIGMGGRVAHWNVRFWDASRRARLQRRSQSCGRHRNLLQPLYWEYYPDNTTPCCAHSVRYTVNDLTLLPVCQPLTLLPPPHIISFSYHADIDQEITDWISLLRKTANVVLCCVVPISIPIYCSVLICLYYIHIYVMVSSTFHRSTIRCMCNIFPFILLPST